MPERWGLRFSGSATNDHKLALISSVKVAPGPYAHSGGGNWQTAEIHFLGQANGQNKL